MKTLQRVWLSCVQLCTLVIISTTASAQLKADFNATSRIGCPPMVVTFEDKSTGTPSEWKWDLGNGTLSYLQNPIATYFNPGTYTVKLVVKNANGADSIARTQYVVVYELPTANFSASDTTGCYPLKVAFFDSSIAGSGNIATWQWDFGDGNLSTQKNPQHTYVNAGDFTVTLRVVNTNGCVRVFTRPAYIKIRSGVKANFNFVTDPLCKAPAIVNFTNQSQGTGALTYQWELGNGTTSTDANPTTSYAGAGNFTVKLVAANSTGCTDTIVKKDVVKIAFVKAGFNRPDFMCVNRPVTFSNTSTPNPLSVSWDFGDGSTSNALSPVKQFTTAGIYQVKMVADFGSCKDSITRSINIIGGPEVSFTANNLVSCKLPNTVDFTNSSLHGVSYFWDFGDGTTSTWQTPSHTYTKFGSYSVKLVVTNASGCKDSIVKTELIKIVPPKITSIKGLPVRECIPYTISPQAVISSNEPIVGYKWDFGDGNISTSALPSHTYTTPGSFTIKLVVNTAEGCSDSMTLKDVVKVGEKTKTGFVANPLDVCAATKVNFYDSTTGPLIHEWFWTFGDGGSSVIQNPVHQYNDTGKFNIMLVTTNFGCSDTLIREKYVHVSPPIARFDTSYLCTDRMTRKFIDKSIGATSWSWDFGDGNTSTQQNPTHTYAIAGNFKVVLTVSNGTCQHSFSKFARVINEKPRLTATDSITCRNARFTYTVSNVTYNNILNYTWYPQGAGGTPIISNIYALAHYYTQPGVVQPYVIVQDLLGCKDTVFNKTNVKVFGPTAGFSAPVTSSCSNSAIAFNDTSKTDGINPIKNWIWNFGDATQTVFTAAPFVHQYDSAGIFGVRLTVVDSYGCRDSVLKANLITVSKPVAAITVSDTLVCPNVPVVFKNLSTGTNLTYQWSFGDGSTTTNVSPTKTYPAEGDFRVNMAITDKFGCKANVDTTIRVVQTTALFAMSDSFSSCPPLQVDFTNQSKGYVVLSYDFGDGGISTLANPSHLYTYPGTYIVKLAVRNNSGCTDTLVRRVRIQGPTGTFTYNPLVVCAPGKIDFNATTQNAVNYVWDYNDGTTLFNQFTKTSHTYSSPGLYVPKIILEDDMGCRVPVTGKDTIKVRFVKTHAIARNVVLCDSGMVAFRDSSVSNDQYKSFTWHFGDGKTSASRTPTHQYTSPGLYTVKLVATTAAGCVDTDSLVNLVKVVNSPKIRIAGDTSVCVPGTLTFSGALVRADTSTLSWNWNFGNGQTSLLPNPPAQLYSTAGTYPVKAVVVNYDGCKDSSTRFAEIRPIPVVYAGADTTICLANNYRLKVTGAAQYTWSFSPTLSCLNCDNPVATPAVNTTYVVTGRTQYGCIASDTVTVNVTQPFTMKVNNGDTLCVGESLKLGASGADNYEWTPSIWLTNANTATPTARPDSTITYRVIGRTYNSCFNDTGYVKIKVYPMPTLKILGDKNVTVNVGNSYQLQTENSADIREWKWMPGSWLSCNNCPNPKVTPKESRTYSVVGINEGKCVARDEITINLVCNNSNVFIPNTFSPNNDGNNDRFYPRGNGVFTIRSMRVFNRWGQVVFESNNFNPNNASAGWDGTMKGQPLSPDVYVYTLTIVCENSAEFPVKGNITLLR